MKRRSLFLLSLSLLLFHAHSSAGKRGGGFGRGFSSKRFHSRPRGNSHTHSGQRGQQGSSSKGGYPKQPGQNHPQSGRPAYPGHHPQQQGGSPFSHSGKGMGIYPQDTSKGFGRSAVMAAAGGAMAGMALGYGLGRFPRPHFHFHSPQEEYYYNHYMYRKYGVKSTDTNDYGRDYTYSQPTKTYDDFMDACMRRTDILPVENRKTTTTTAAAVSQSGNTTKSNNTAAGNSPAAVPSLLQGINVSEASPVPAASHDDAARDAEDDDTVSIEEIGYPALIRQMKARRCLELYMVYSERYLKRKTPESSARGGVRRLEMGLRGFLAVIISFIVTLQNIKFEFR